MKEVFITAYTGWTPIGRSRAEIAAALRAGKTGIVPHEFRGYRGNQGHGALNVAWADERGRLEAEDRRFAKLCSDSGLLALRVVEQLLAEETIDLAALDRTRIACVGVALVDSPLATWRQFEVNPARADLYHYNRYMPSATSGLMGKRFGIEGPCLNTAMACGGGGSALFTAWNMLQTGKADAAIVSGVNLLHEQPLFVNALMRFGGVSPSGRVAYAGAERDGFVSGDTGVAILVETGEHVRRRGGTPRFLLRAIEVGNDGFDAFVPTVEGMSRLYALIKREVGPVDYINPHGAGTKVGDPIEITTMRAAYEDRPFVNSTKAYTGHALEACFLQELIHTMIQVEDGFVAATPHTQEVDEDCRGVRLVLGEAVESRLRTAICHNLGLGGVNVAACVERVAGG